MSPKSKVATRPEVRRTSTADARTSAAETATDGLSTQPKVQKKPVGGTVRELARYWWRQLTSMRTALILLFLLALAAIPGSLLPQRSLNASKVSGYFTAHPTLAPILDTLGFFEVFAAPWFAAIYLLLFVSLIGCLVPRIRLHWRNVRSTPPVTPRRLSRLGEYADGPLPEAPDEVVARAEQLLRSKRWRVVRRAEPGGVVTLSAEKGYLRETGNLVFHVSLVALLVALALGKFNGYEGSLLLTEGDGFCNTAQQYDNFRSGDWVDGADMAPVCVDLETFRTTYDADLTPAKFAAKISWGQIGKVPTETTIGVNSPLRTDGIRVYATGHGYAPEFTVTKPDGTVIAKQSAPFLPTNSQTFDSEGVVKFPDVSADPNDALAIQGTFAPTAVVTNGLAVSRDPRALNPAVSIVAYRGLLGLDSGDPQSVFALDQTQIKAGTLARVGTGQTLKLGEAMTLPDGTKITFSGLKQWAAIQLSHDPGQVWVLVAALVAITGVTVSLRLRRRRFFLRARPRDDDGSTVEIGGLAHTAPAAFAEEFVDLRRRMLQAEPPDTATSDHGTSEPQTPTSRTSAPQRTDDAHGG